MNASFMHNNLQVHFKICISGLDTASDGQATERDPYVEGHVKGKRPTMKLAVEHHAIFLLQSNFSIQLAHAA